MAVKIFQSFEYKLGVIGWMRMSADVAFISNLISTSIFFSINILEFINGCSISWIICRIILTMRQFHFQKNQPFYLLKFLFKTDTKKNNRYISTNQKMIYTTKSFKNIHYTNKHKAYLLLSVVLNTHRKTKWTTIENNNQKKRSCRKGKLAPKDKQKKFKRCEIKDTYILRKEKPMVIFNLPE